MARRQLPAAEAPVPVGARGPLMPMASSGLGQSPAVAGQRAVRSPE
jgi:hypothetical protein